MSHDDRFEQELRATLDGLAAEPAPDRLVERVAGIPRRAHSSTARRGPVRSVATRLATLRIATFQLVTGVAAAAILVLAAVLILATRPAGGLFVGGRPGGATPSPASASPASVTSPGGLPGASGVSVAPGASGPVVTPSSAPLPSGVPAGGPVPVGFRAASVTFVSTDLGWVLGTAPCNAPPCTSILRTADGGRTWKGIPAPVTPLSPGGVAGPGSGVTGVSGLRFADPLDGWAFGPQLWATHDGGSTWRQVAIPGLAPDASIVALETLRGVVHAVAYDGGGAFRIASSPVASDGWSVSPAQIQVGAGPVPGIQLVLSGAGGWVVEVDRTVVGGARLVSGAWTAWTPPCMDVLGPASLAASSATEVVAACDGGVWGPPKDALQQGEHLYVSHDGGTTFTQLPGSVPLSDPSAIASSGPSVVVLGGWLSQTQGPAIVATFDGGQTWTTLHLQGNVTVTYLGFTTPAQGVAIVQAGGQGGSLLMTRDGGHTWSTVAFGGG